MFLNLLANEIDPSLYDKNISVGEAAIERTAGGKTDERARKERARRSDDFRIQRYRRRNDSRDFRSDRRILCGRIPYLRICGETY